MAAPGEERDAVEQILAGIVGVGGRKRFDRHILDVLTLEAVYRLDSVAAEALESTRAEAVKAVRTTLLKVVK